MLGGNLGSLLYGDVSVMTQMDVQLICAFVFHICKSRFSHDVYHFIVALFYAM